MHGLLRTIGIIFLANAGLAFYHAGIEYGFWLGPATCGGGGLQASDTSALLEALKSSSMVRCDAPSFTLFGVSLAGYNLIACVGLAGLSLYPTHDEKV
jgi:disulfide bond formation protein DsbB